MTNNTLCLYHGSLHKFTKFNLTKRGSGEGCATQGYGIYFSRSKDYAEKYTGTFFTSGGRNDFMCKWNRHVIFDGKMVKQDREKDWHDISPEEYESAYQDALSILKEKTDLNIYDVRFESKEFESESSESLIMDWNKSIDEQPEIKAKLIKAGLYTKHGENKGRSYTPDNACNAARLKKAGILGLTYKGLTEENRNYVIWDLKSLSIETINDLPIKEACQLKEFRQTIDDSELAY